MDDAPHEPAPVWPDAPRHAPEVPFPRYRFVPEHHPHPRRDPAGSLYGRPEPPPGKPPERWREDTTYLHGVDLYHHGYLWESHEAWEACYHAAAGPDRALLQALIQLAAALLQVHRGRAKGVRILVAKVLRRLDEAAAALPPDGRLRGLDPRAIREETVRFFANALAPEGDPLQTAGEPPRLELPPSFTYRVRNESSR